MVPGDWGVNFETIFDYFDCVISRRIASDTWKADEEITMVDLNDWEGDLDELMELNPSLVSSSFSKYYWTFEVDEVLWQSENTPSKVKKGDILLFTESPIMFNYKAQLKRDGEYIFAADYNDKIDAWTTIKNAGFYKTDQDFLFSFVSGDNTNKYTGEKVGEYTKDLKKAFRKWDKEVKEGTYVEKIDWLEE